MGAGISRRRFVQGAAAAAFSASCLISRRALAANDVIRVGVVGLGIRGLGTHIPRMAELPGVAIAAVCDADRSRMAAAAKLCEEKYNQKVHQDLDVRSLLDRKDIDVVCNATQQYWHALGTIWACQAGKHVYVEKPLSHYIWEGRQMVNAARKYKRIVQCGTQQRSCAADGEIIAWIRDGNLGKIKLVTAFADKLRTSVGKRSEPLPIPPEIDYDLWCGPAKKLPIYRDKLQYDCSFDWNTGDGESANQGVHEIDLARWLLGVDEWPRRVMSIGGRFAFDDAADCPNTQIIYYDYPDMPLIYQVHNMSVAKGSNQRTKFRGWTRGAGVAVDCEGGYAIINFGGKVYDNKGKLIKKFTGREDHFANFIEAVRAGRPELLNADVLEGHRSTCNCHAGNISYRLGRKAAKDDIRRVTREIPAWDETFDRLLAHLKAHEIDVDAATITLGPWLRPVPGEERFENNPEADRLVKGLYREKFMVPEVSV
ncbi:MAG: Gfo/Idh/MocA family oxidoreductase [Pirellulales bacterium]|nr:Gfo/Idh/MocA family oxidoreductase [Pirellulales bacterium]